MPVTEEKINIINGLLRIILTSVAVFGIIIGASKPSFDRYLEGKMRRVEERIDYLSFLITQTLSKNERDRINELYRDYKRDYGK